MNLLIKA